MKIYFSITTLLVPILFSGLSHAEDRTSIQIFPRISISSPSNTVKIGKEERTQQIKTIRLDPKRVKSSAFLSSCDKDLLIAIQKTKYVSVDPSLLRAIEEYNKAFEGRGKGLQLKSDKIGTPYIRAHFHFESPSPRLDDGNRARGLELQSLSLSLDDSKSGGGTYLNYHLPERGSPQKKVEPCNSSPRSIQQLADSLAEKATRILNSEVLSLKNLLAQENEEEMLRLAEKRAKQSFESESEAFTNDILTSPESVQ